MTEELIIKALLHLADSCDGAKKPDGKGFNKLDATFGNAMAEKVAGGEKLSRTEYSDIRKMLQKYQKQLAEIGIDPRMIAGAKEAFNSESNKQQFAEETANRDIKWDTDVLVTANFYINEGLIPSIWRETSRRKHIGDEHVPLVMLAASLTANIKNSHGIATLEANGPSGDGKSNIVLLGAKTMGPKWCDVSGLSAKAMLYHAGKTIFEGMMVVLDDNRPDDAQEDIRKRSQTQFKEGYKYKTLTSDRHAVVLQMPPGVSTISTQVVPKNEDEVQNRMVTFEVKGDLNKDIKIIDGDLERLETGERPEEDPDITVCQCILDILKSKRYIVVIPDAKQRLKWHERSPNGRANIRNWNIFRDLILAFAVMNYRVRKNQEKEDGTIIVEATKKDFDLALEIYMTIYPQMQSKLSEQERCLIKQISDAGGKLSKEDAQKKMGVTEGRLSQIVRGVNNKGGLANKCPAFYVETDKDRRHIYRLNTTAWGDSAINLPAEWIEEIPKSDGEKSLAELVGISEEIEQLEVV
jgi:hypothetical protein